MPFVAAAFASGVETWNIDPHPSELSTAISPPCCFAIKWAIANFTYAIMAIVMISVTPIVVGWWRQRRRITAT